MFDSIYSLVASEKEVFGNVSLNQFLFKAAVAVVTGILYAWIMSFRVRAKSRFFAVTALLPFAVGMMITFVNGNIGLAVATGGIFALTRFRSAQSTSDEIAAVLIAVAGGVAFGMGYLAYGVLTLLCVAAMVSATLAFAIVSSPFRVVTL